MKQQHSPVLGGFYQLKPLQSIVVRHRYSSSGKKDPFIKHPLIIISIPSSSDEVKVVFITSNPLPRLLNSSTNPYLQIGPQLKSEIGYGRKERLRMAAVEDADGSVLDMAFDCASWACFDKWKYINFECLRRYCDMDGEQFQLDEASLELLVRWQGEVEMEREAERREMDVKRRVLDEQLTSEYARRLAREEKEKEEEKEVKVKRSDGGDVADESENEQPEQDAEVDGQPAQNDSERRTNYGAISAVHTPTVGQDAKATALILNELTHQQYTQDQLETNKKHGGISIVPIPPIYEDSETTIDTPNTPMPRTLTQNADIKAELVDLVQKPDGSGIDFAALIEEQLTDPSVISQTQDQAVKTAMNQRSDRFSDDLTEKHGSIGDGEIGEAAADADADAEELEERQ